MTTAMLKRSINHNVSKPSDLMTGKKTGIHIMQIAMGSMNIPRKITIKSMITIIADEPNENVEIASRTNWPVPVTQWPANRA